MIQMPGLAQPGWTIFQSVISSVRDIKKFPATLQLSDFPITTTETSPTDWNTATTSQLACYS